MRLLGGSWKDSPLISPSGPVRPSHEELRRKLFNKIEFKLRGLRVLDLFAGTGALGLEALSRGAKSADFIENGESSLHALKANLAAHGLLKKGINTARLFKRDAIPFVEALPEFAYDLAFADPPYLSRKLDRVLLRQDQLPFARILLVEHSLEHEMPVLQSGPGRQLFKIESRAVTAFGDFNLLSL